MMRMKTSRLILVTLATLVIISVGLAFSANNIVPTTRLTDQVLAITANALKPSSCSALNLTAVVICTGGVCNGSNANELLLGSSGYDNIKGKNGDDCIIGGGSNDDIDGGNNNDVCIGGPGTDTFKKCETQIQ